MINLIPYNLKTIIRNKLNIIYLIFLFSFSLLIFIPAASTPDANVAIGLPTYANVFSLIFFIFFSIYTFESFYNIKDVNLYETFSTNYNGLYRVWISRIIVILLMVFISVLPLLIQYTIFFYKFNLDKSLYLNWILSIVLDFAIVAFIGCMLGALLSIKNNRINGYLKIIVSVFLISPLLISIINNLYMHLGSIDSFNIFPLVNRVQILPPNLLLGDYSLYGLPMESIRWESAIMWIIVLYLALKIRISETRKKLYVLILSSVIILWMCIAFIITPNDSLVRKDERFFDGEMSDYYYDLESPQQLKPPTFTVAEYSMSFKVRRQLHGDVDIVIGEKSEDSVYNFTLYRGYNISSITDQNGNALEYSREGHYIYISACNDTEIINIKYKGNGNRFYSNNQGIALTGNFPYYPVAGYTTIAIQTTNNEIQFNVNIDTRQEVFSNLDGENNEFSGVSDTVTLVSGFLKEYNSEGFTIVGNTKYADNINISDLQTEIANINLRLSTDINLNKENMTILCPPDYIFFDDGYIEPAMIYDNQIITIWTHNSKGLCWAIVSSSLPEDQGTIILKSVLLEALFHMDSLRGNNPSMHPSDREIETYKNPSNENIFQKETVITKLLLYQIDALGEEVALSQIYDYLKNYDGSVEQLDFLLGME